MIQFCWCSRIVWVFFMKKGLYNIRLRKFPSREEGNLSEVHDSDGAKSLQRVTPRARQNTLKPLLILSDLTILPTYLSSSSSDCLHVWCKVSFLFLLSFCHILIEWSTDYRTEEHLSHHYHIPFFELVVWYYPLRTFITIPTTDKNLRYSLFFTAKCDLPCQLHTFLSLYNLATKVLFELALCIMAELSM